MNLSVLIPVYNAESYIGNCLESLINQDLPKEDYEIIVFDDGSTDGTLALIKHYAERYENIVWFSEANRGVCMVRNKMISLAKGEYIYFLDADDYLVHNCLKKILRKALEFNVDLIGFKTIATNKLDDYAFNDEGFKMASLTLQTGYDFIRDYRNLRHEIWWYFIKKSFLIHENIIFDAQDFNGDVVFTLKLLMRSKKVVYLPFSSIFLSFSVAMLCNSKKPFKWS
ncbi:glycosyltransferase family 2 protein [Winogradskyella psychrotolerans]|uniref:glycosyltransferase family 2 protein n=1 Tax=Winogradskyella psychrotolerans TaxID=1344585 RepID=UPI001C06F68C|nr:glycosyltransferase family A protein [Winogradskyella psychrotolerans]MBU2929109.1 glycosyltransferase family 2 protein [Winogradskyella psychrotolerans]